MRKRSISLLTGDKTNKIRSHRICHYNFTVPHKCCFSLWNKIRQVLKFTLVNEHSFMGAGGGGGGGAFMSFSLFSLLFK